MPCVPKKCPPSVDPGSLRTQVDVQRQVLANDGAGGQVVTWVPLGTMMSSVEQTAGSETYTDEQLEEIGAHTITTRWQSVEAFDLKPMDRLVIFGTLFQIRSIQNVGYAFTIAKILAERGVVT